MTIVSIQTLLNNAVLGKRLAMQPNIDKEHWGKAIVDVSPTELDYGCDAGFVIYTEGTPHLGIIVLPNQELMFED